MAEGSPHLRCGPIRVAGAVLVRSRDVHRVERPRRHRESAIQRIGTGVRADRVALRSERADDGAALPGVRRAPANRRGRLSARGCECSLMCLPVAERSFTVSGDARCAISIESQLRESGIFRRMVAGMVVHARIGERDAAPLPPGRDPAIDAAFPRLLLVPAEIEGRVGPVEHHMGSNVGGRGPTRPWPPTAYPLRSARRTKE